MKSMWMIGAMAALGQAAPVTVVFETVVSSISKDSLGTLAQAGLHVGDSLKYQFIIDYNSQPTRYENGSPSIVLDDTTTGSRHDFSYAAFSGPRHASFSSTPTSTEDHLSYQPDSPNQAKVLLVSYRGLGVRYSNFAFACVAPGGKITDTTSCQGFETLEDSSRSIFLFYVNVTKITVGSPSALGPQAEGSAGRASVTPMVPWARLYGSGVFLIDGRAVKEIPKGR